MTADNFEATVTELVTHRPFQVFVIELHGGARYEVDHPNSLAYRGGRAVFLRPGGGPVVFDHESVTQIHLATVSDLTGDSDAA